MKTICRRLAILIILLTVCTGLALTVSAAPGRGQTYQNMVFKFEGSPDGWIENLGHTIGWAQVGAMDSGSVIVSNGGTCNDNPSVYYTFDSTPFTVYVTSTVVFSSKVVSETESIPPGLPNFVSVWLHYSDGQFAETGGYRTVWSNATFERRQYIPADDAFHTISFSLGDYPDESPGGTIDQWGVMVGMCNKGDFYLDHFSIDGTVSDEVTPTPTPTRTTNGSEATPWIYHSTQACSTYVTPTPTWRPTSTRTITGTAQATATGPTPTRTPTPQATPQAYDSGEENFTTSLGSWGLAGSPASASTPASGEPAAPIPPENVITTTTWVNATGRDGKEGVARVGNSFDYYWSWLGDDAGYLGMDTTLETYYDMLKFTLPRPLSTTVHVAGSAQYVGKILAGDSVYMRVLFYSPNYTGPDVISPTASWVAPSSASAHLKYIPISKSWQYFDWEYTPVSYTITAIGIAWVKKNDAEWEWLGPTSRYNINIPDAGAVYVDDLHITSGSNPQDLKLPVCPGGGGGPVTTHTCAVTMVTVDMFKVCKAPTNVFDLGAWLTYLWCNISHYFGFYDDNRAQVDAIVERQGKIEPLGSMVEFDEIYSDLDSAVMELQRRNKYQVQTPIDWAKMMLDGSPFDNLPRFGVPSHTTTGEYMANCPSEVSGFANSTASGACMAIFLYQASPVAMFLQWFVNAIFVLGILRLMQADLGKLSE